MGGAQRIAAGSILVGCVVLAMKAAAWRLTGSAAFYSDALESVVNVAAGLLALLALRLAAKPADANHPYGHDKAEVFAAAVESGLIITAALSILDHAWRTARDLHPIALPLAAIALNATASLVNGLWGMVLLRTGRRVRSQALLANARHLFSDVVTSVGIVVGIALAVSTGLLILDPLLAAATAVYILWSGFGLLRSSVGGLMDEAPPVAIVGRVRDLVSTHAAGALEAHDLRMRHAGRLTFLEFHLVVPRSMTVADSHDICDRIEAALKAAITDLVITIHVEPEEKAKHHGVPVQ